MLLNNKFGVAIVICNQLSFGWGYLRTKNIIMKKLHTKMVYKKIEKNEEKKKGQPMKNPSNFKLESSKKLHMFSSTFTNCCFKGELRD